MHGMHTRPFRIEIYTDTLNDQSIYTTLGYSLNTYRPEWMSDAVCDGGQTNQNPDVKRNLYLDLWDSIEVYFSSCFLLLFFWCVDWRLARRDKLNFVSFAQRVTIIILRAREHWSFLLTINSEAQRCRFRMSSVCLASHTQRIGWQLLEPSGDRTHHNAESQFSILQ